MISYARIKSQVSIYDALNLIGQPVRRGWRGKVSCPLKEHHPKGDQNPSCKIYEESNSLHCFVANRSWDVVGLVAEYKGIPQHAAAEWIYRTMNLDMVSAKAFIEVTKRVIGKDHSDDRMKRRVAESYIAEKIQVINNIVRSHGLGWDIIGGVLDTLLNEFELTCSDITSADELIEKWRDVLKWAIREQERFNKWRVEYG